MKVHHPFRLVLAAAALALAVACASTRTQQAPGEYADDATVTAQVKTALAASPQVKAHQVDVETFRGVVQLNGFVDSAQAREAATGVARGVKGVREVHNNLAIESKDETVATAADDTMITGKVKAALIDDPLTKAGQINVETENGVVMLGGFVNSTSEKAQAEKLARSVSGVRSVRNELDIKQGP